MRKNKGQDGANRMRRLIIAAILRIPRGKVSTYGGVAKAAGYPRGARQVARTLCSAVGLPWQRVVGAGGAIKLQGEDALEQRMRLQAEGVSFRGRRVDMHRHEFKDPRALRRARTKRSAGH